jgi:C_GCAxxG_C_C family probable redox protein
VGEHTWADWDPRYVRVSTSLGGGVAGTRQELCGALSGGILVIGGLLGRQDPDTDDTEAYALGEKFRARFLAAMGDTQCDRLRTAIEAPGGPGTCALLVAQTAAILLDLLNGASPTKHEVRSES